MSTERPNPANDVPAAASLPLLVRPFASLAFREYRLLWLSQIGASSAMWTEQVARNWLTYQMTGSALQLGLVNLMQALPIVVLGLWGGVLTDRFDKRRLLIAIQAWSMTVYVVMGLVVISGNLALWHLYASSFAVAIGMAMDGPLRTSTIPSIVPKERLINALSLNGIAINGTRLLLPAGVGVMLGVTNPGWAYIALAVIYLGNQVLSAQLRLPSVSGRKEGRSMLAELGDGLKFGGRNADVRSVLIVAVGVQGIGFASRALIPVLAAERLGAGAGAYGVLLSADGAGAVIGGLILATVGLSNRKGLIMVLFAAANAVGILLLGWAPWLLAAAFLSMIIGGTSTVFRSSSNSLLLGNTPLHMRGRVMSINGLNNGIAPVSIAIVGAIAEATSVSVAITVIGSASLVLNGLALVMHRRLLKL
jgi:MFS family permease